MRRMYSENQLLKSIEKESQENGLKVFENIVDKDGHPRFIEGEIDMPSTEGFTRVYGKWSLSGTHLMIVHVVKFANTTSLVDNQSLGSFIVPKWIYDKIALLWGNRVIRRQYSLRAADGQMQNLEVNLNKSNTDTCELAITAATSGITMSSEKTGRFDFDLLIDNE